MCVRTRIYEFSPAGTAEGCPGLRRGRFSAVPAGLGRPFKSNPGLASWAKFSRPCGTEFGNPGSHTHSLAPQVRLSPRLRIEHLDNRFPVAVRPKQNTEFVLVVLRSVPHLKPRRVGNSCGTAKGVPVVQRFPDHCLAHISLRIRSSLHYALTPGSANQRLTDQNTRISK